MDPHQTAQSTAGRRLLAWTCVLALLLVVAAPAPDGPHALLAPAGPLFGQSVEFTIVCIAARVAPPDLLVALAVPARAPPLA